MLGMLAGPTEQRFRRWSHSEIADVLLGARGRYAWHPPPRQRLTHAPEGTVGGLCFFAPFHIFPSPIFLFMPQLIHFICDATAPEP